MSGYIWARSDALDAPSTYFYTLFEGASLLDDWRRSRDDMIGSGPAAPAPPVLHAAGPSLRDDGMWDGRSLVEAAFAESVAGDACSPDLIGLLDVLCRRFEVTKRLHDGYEPSAPHRSRDQEVLRDAGPYVRFGEALTTRLHRDLDLRDLNALLKLGDTLAAVWSVADDGHRARIRSVIRGERAAVARVASTVGVSS